MGNVKYIGWSMTFYCKLDLVEILQDQARSMENELTRWKKDVARARNDFYELNYYTTRQLLMLRSELGKLKRNELGAKISPQVLALLQSVSLKVSTAQICKAIKNVRSCPLEERDCTMAKDSSSKTTRNSGIPKQKERLLNAAELTIADLQPEEKAIYTYLKDKCGQSTKHILMAFKHCDLKNKHTLNKWIIERRDEEYDSGSDGDESEEENEEEEGEAEDEEDNSTINEPGDISSIQSPSQNESLMCEENGDPLYSSTPGLLIICSIV